MGTNYSARKILTEKDWNDLESLLQNRDIDNLEFKTAELTESVHICKCSAGLKPNFDHNYGRYYHPNRKSIDEFLKDKYITNEYDCKYTVEEFWDIIDEHNKIGEVEKLPTKYLQSHIQLCKELFNIDAPNGNFIQDGLVFPVFGEFT